MTANIKKLYSDYKAAHEATEAVDIMDETKFEQMLDIECDKLDALVNAIIKTANGAINEFDLRYIITNPKFSARFESLVKKLAA